MLNEGVVEGVLTSQEVDPCSEESPKNRLIAILVRYIRVVFSDPQKPLLIQLVNLAFHSVVFGTVSSKD